MIIDAHAHMAHGQYLDPLITAGADWAKKKITWLLEQTRTTGKPYFDVAIRVEQLDRNGIGLQVVTPSHLLDSNLLPGDVTAQLDFAQALNENMAKLMEDSKGRLLGIGSIPLAEFEQGGRQKMERAIKTMGLKGVSVPSNINGKPLDMPEFEPFWASAADMGIPIFIHPNDPVGRTDRSYEAEYDLMHNFGWPFETALALSRLVFSGIMERYPTLKVVSHHLGGGMIPFYWNRILETYESENQKQIYGGQAPVLTKPLLDYFSRFYYDTAVGGSAPAIRCTCEVFGVEPIAFRYGCPMGTGNR